MHKITPEMLISFREMLLSEDACDTKLALDILENRNRKDEETQNNFELLKKEIIQNDILFPKYKKEIWVIKAGNEILTMQSGRCSFHNKAGASKSLARHLSLVIKSGENIARWTEEAKKVYYSSYKQALLGKTLKNIFRDAKTLREFLINEKIVEIVKIG